MLLAATSYVAAGAETVERTAEGETNKYIRIGVYVNIQPDCTSGPLPTIRLVEPPAHGKVTVKKANFNATNYNQCLALTAPAYVAFYRSEKDFLGSDSVLLEVRYPSGKQELQHIVITVRGPGAGNRLDDRIGSQVARQGTWLLRLDHCPGAKSTLRSAARAASQIKLAV